MYRSSRFGELLKGLPRAEFNRLVAARESDKHCKGFDVYRVGPPKLTDINNKTTYRTPVEDRYTRYFVKLLESKLITPFAALSVQIT